MSVISQQAKSGVFWVSLSQIIQPGWEFVVGIVLARLLTPKDFGIVAMGGIFFSLATAVSNMGISNVLIQKEKLEQIDIDTSQTIAALFGVIIYIVLVLVSYFVSAFFKEPQVAGVLRVFSLNFLINGIAMIPAALLTKEMRFKAISIIDILSSVIYGFSALFMSYLGYGLWSLVYSVILSALFRSIASCIVASYIPRFGWHNATAVHIFKFGGGLTTASVLNYTARNLDFFIIGKYLGSAQLGLYKRAYDLAVIPKEKVADSLSRVLLPFLCKIRDDKAWTKSAFLKTIK
ncbi:MAG: lipopolysaccharide biosynthesis protein, partial [Pedobacter sp.]